MSAKGPRRAGRGQVRPEHQSARVDVEYAIHGVGNVQLDTSETGRLYERARFDQVQQVGETVCAQAEVVDAECRQLHQSRQYRAQFAGIDIDLAVPTGQIVDATREPVKIAETCRTAAANIESDRSDTDGIEPQDLVIGRLNRDLGDADECGSSAVRAAVRWF